jgi:hypothetical protein
MAAAGAIHESEIDLILGPVVRARTYRNLLYLFLAFPLGIVYFVSMVVGLALGAGLAVLWIGFVILAFTLLLARVFVLLERPLTASLLGANLKPLPSRGKGLRATLLDRRNWTRVLYLILHFPIGIAGLVSSILFLTAALAMAAPILYPVVPYFIENERITSSEPALLISLLGCVLFLFMVYVINGLAALSRRLAEALI